MIIVKPGVVFTVFTPEVVYLLQKIPGIWKKHTLMIPVITSANEGQHIVNSYHKRNYAIDLRSQNLTAEEKKNIFNDLKKLLSPKNYDVLLESKGTNNEHFHIEFNKGK